MENSTEHRPDSDLDACHCGAQEVYFEGHALDPGDLGPTVGYGCDAVGRPYTGLLARTGWHLASPNTRWLIAIEMTDDELDSLSDDDFARVDAVRNPRR